MSRTILHVLAAATLLLVPSSAFAQKEPPRPKELKDAEKFIATAQMTSDAADRKSRFERALNPLQQAMARDPNNAYVWFALGQVYAGLADYVHADSAYRRAEELYAPLAKDVTDERLRSWGDALNQGVDMMEKQDYPAAIALLEAAERMYAGRPESKINLAVLYANQGERDRAVDVFRSVLKLVEAPPVELNAEEQTHWKRFKELSTVNLAAMLGQRGVDAFEAQRYDDAIASFREAHGLNAQTRDFSFNLAESMFAKARKLEQTRATLLDEAKAARAKKDAATADAKTAEAKRIADDLNTLYADMEPLVAHALTMDPNNKDLYLLKLRSYQVRGELTSDAAAKAEYAKRLNELLALHDALSAEVGSLSITTGSAEATVRGQVRNLKLAQGTPLKVRLTLLGLDGGVIGEGEVAVTAPAADQAVPFETKVPTTGELAGWKYQIVK